LPQDGIQLLAGLGNPGPRYVATRHNVGFWLLDETARRHGGQFRTSAKFHADCCQVALDGRQLWLLKPQTWMNRSGQSLRAFLDFYKLRAESVLVAHDEIDLPPGSVRLKLDGGHGGHNGLRDIHAHLGSDRYRRLRIGVGHPGIRDDVVGYVLTSPPAAERDQIAQAIDVAVDELVTIARGDFAQVMNRLHGR